MIEEQELEQGQKTLEMLTYWKVGTRERNNHNKEKEERRLK
jgi:hypothetical protein